MGLKTFVTDQISKLEKILNEVYVTKPPLQLPPWLKDLIVRLLPLFIVVMIPLSIFAIYLSCFDTCNQSNNFGLSFISWLFQLFAIWGLFRRRKSGWNLLFYASVINVIKSVLALSVIGLFFDAVVGWYFIFQVRSMYK